MKILVLPAWYPNLNNKHGTFFREQAHFLNKNGYEVKILMVEELNTKCYWFHRLKRIVKGKHNCLSTDFLIQDPEAYSFPVIIQKSWSDEKKLRVVDKAYLKAFSAMTEKNNWFPEIIHLQGMYKYGLSSYMIAQVYNVPLVVIEHSPFRMGNYNKAQQERIGRIFEIARKIAGVSHLHRTHLSVVKYKRELEVVWNFMDEQMFSIEKFVNSGDTFIITTILRLSSIKGPIDFFDAILKFIEIIDKDKPIEVHVVGFSCLEELTKLKDIDDNFIVKYEKLRKILKFRPWLSRNEITALHQKSSVYISTSTHETFGVALREAMLCGVPVISTRSGGPEDIIASDIGLLVDVGDIEGIAKNLQAIYKGNISFNPKKLREQVVLQNGREAYLKRMEEFYFD